MNRPNILILHADQHQQTCMGAYGNAEVQTPNMDALARDGVCYTNHFTPYPVCTPSRYSLLTGLYAHQHLGASNRCTLPAGLDTFPRILKQAGYRTAAVGKMHFTPTYLDVGYERLCLSEQDGDGRMDDDYHRSLMAKGLWDCADTLEQVNSYRMTAGEEYWKNFGSRPSDLSEEDYSTPWIAARAAEELDGWTQGGNLLTVGFIKPHHPFDPPGRWAEYYDPNALTLPEGWQERCPALDFAYAKGFYPNNTLTEKVLRQCLADYYAAITQVDEVVGQLIAQLKAKGIYDNTLIVYTSDHGEYMGFHHMMGKSNFMYDPLMKIPLLVKYPKAANIAPGRDARLCENVDLAPTLLRQAGCEIGEFMCGKALTDDAQKGMVFAQLGEDTQFMARSKTRKLLYCKNPALHQFFDLEKDPLERCNLYHDPAYQAEIAQYTEALLRWRLLDAPPPIHLDMAAPITNCSNALHPRDGHREKIEAYMKQKMADYDTNHL